MLTIATLFSSSQYRFSNEKPCTVRHGVALFPRSRSYRVSLSAMVLITAGTRGTAACSEPTLGRRFRVRGSRSPGCGQGTARSLLNTAQTLGTIRESPECSSWRAKEWVGLVEEGHSSGSKSSPRKCHRALFIVEGQGKKSRDPLPLSPLHTKDPLESRRRTRQPEYGASDRPTASGLAPNPNLHKHSALRTCIDPRRETVMIAKANTRS